ncbi:MAG: hypothetical protein ACE5G5_04465 [Candidatus Methylomirabilales bacterium]
MVVCVFIMTVLLATPVVAQEQTAPVIVDIGPGVSPPAMVRHVFAGRSVSLPMVVYGPPDARVDLKARLFRVTRSLAVPVGDVEIASDIEFTRGVRRKLTFDVAVPAVKREAAFQLAVFIRVHPKERWRQVGRLHLRVYPEDLLKPLQAWTKRQPLRLHDTTGKLENFLKAQGVAFLDLNARSLEDFDEPVVTLIAGEPDALALAKRQAKRGEAVIIFQEQVVTLPRVEERPWEVGSVVNVEMELLDRLPMDPKAQKAFLEIIESARSKDNWGDGGVQ